MPEDLSGQLPDGFPGAERLHPANYFQLDVGAATRNTINIWLPESFRSKDKKIHFATAWQTTALTWERTEAGGVRLTGDADGLLRFVATMHEFRYGATMTLDVENVSGEAINGIHTGACVQLAMAPDFVDLGRERTFWRREGQWRGFPECRPGTEGRCLFFSSDAGPDLPLIVTESSTGPHAVGVICQGSERLFGNCHGCIGCIHSNPADFDLEPGQTHHLDMRLFLHPEGKDAVLALAEAFWAEFGQT